MSEYLNDSVRLRIDSLGFEGVSVGRRDGIVHFVKGALPSELVDVKIIKKKKSYKLAKVIEIIEKSPERIEPKCMYFGTCGGCSWQHLSYNSQLKWKKNHVEEALQRIGKVEIGEIYDTMPAPIHFGYRNKMDFSFSHQRWITEEEIASGMEIENKYLALGLHIPERFDKVLDIHHCDIQHEYANLILNYVREQAKEFNQTGFNIIKHSGFLRNLIIRRSEFQDKFLVILVTNLIENAENSDFVNQLSADIMKKYDKISGFVHAINFSKNNSTINESKLLEGSDTLVEEILGVEYEISPFSFFQTNSVQLNPFISKILEFTDPNKSDVIWDLYCGTGSITLPASKLCSEIYGFELVESSINDADRNKAHNNIENVHFTAVDLHAKNIGESLKKYPQPDIVIVDPPRNGLHNNLTELLIAVNPRKIIYVSCNPATQARDLNLLSPHYKVTKVQPVDMFPQTFHVESIAELVRL